MRVLFVDDEPSGLAELRHALAVQRPTWDVKVAASPSMAVAWCERFEFDVVLIASNTLPFGTKDPFAYFHEHFPKTVRIAILSDNEERRIHMETLAYQAIYHQQPVGEIIETIERAVELHTRLANPKVRGLVGSVQGLPSPPRIITNLNAALARPQVTVNQITDIISEDIAIPARVLHVVNTAYFALSRTMTSIREAVAYLGFDAVRNLALAVEMFRELADPDSVSSVRQVEILQMHSSAVAQMTRQLITNRQDAQDAFVGGLLHDIGHLAMATYFPTEYSEIRERVGAGCEILEAEKSILGATHCDIGAYLLSQWGLPYRIIDIVAFHHEAPRFTSLGMDSVHGVYIGEHLLAERKDPDTSYWEFFGLPKMDDEYLDNLGVYERVTSWRMLHVGFGSLK